MTTAPGGSGRADVEVDMKFLVVTDDADRPELEEAMRHLRERQTRAVIDSTRAEIGADLDELLELWMARG